MRSAIIKNKKIFVTIVIIATVILFFIIRFVIIKGNTERANNRFTADIAVCLTEHSYELDSFDKNHISEYSEGYGNYSYYNNSDLESIVGYYDNPDDFADDWGDYFDNYGDAEDYWEDYY